MANRAVSLIHCCGLVLKGGMAFNRHAINGGGIQVVVGYTPGSILGGELLKIRVMSDPSLLALHLPCLKFNKCFKK